MNHLTGTQVKIVEHPSKQFVGKIGILDPETPDTKKPGRFPVQIDEIGKIAWCKLDWLEVVTLEGEPASEVGKAEVSVGEEPAPILNPSAATVELLASTDSEPEALVVGVVSAGVVTLDASAEPSARTVALATIAEEPVVFASEAENQTEAPLMDAQDSARLRAFVASEAIEIELNRIELSGGTQSRAGFDESTLNEYIEGWERGVKFPAIELYFDGQKYWLADGFHRVVSRQRAKIPGSTIAAIIHQGTYRDAVLASVGANASHGLRRTHADKRRAVELLLRDREWGKWSDREIARRCGVGNKFVGDLRRSLCSEHSEIPARSVASEEQSERTFTTKHGTTAIMRTGSIGKKAELKTPTENSVPSTVEEELQRQAKELGLGGRGKEQLLPTVDRNHTSPVDVDDRPFTTLSPSLVTTPAAASSWDEGVQFAVVVGNGIPIQVKYEPLADGERHLLNFTGPVERSGECAYYLLPDRALEEGTPQVLAQRLAENFYQQLQTSSPHPMKTLDDSGSEAITPSIEEYRQVVEEAELLKAERDELKQKLAEANTEIERLEQEMQELQGQLRMSA